MTSATLWTLCFRTAAWTQRATTVAIRTGITTEERGAIPPIPTLSGKDAMCLSAVRQYYISGGFCGIVNDMVNVDLYSAVITRVSNALNTLISGEKPGAQFTTYLRIYHT